MLGRFVMHVKRTEHRAFARSREMADCLRRELLYSEKRPRDTVFRTIEQILLEQDRPGEHRILSRLTREAIARAGRHASSTSVRWDVTGKTVVKAMIGAGVLLTPNGQPVPDGIAAPATPVATVRDEFEDITEAFLLETLIRRLNDVTVHDHRALAHALFRQFDRSVPLEDLEDRVVVLLARLADRIELQGDRYVPREFRVNGARRRAAPAASSAARC
jgi:hypothetical protein